MRKVMIIILSVVLFAECLILADTLRDLQVLMKAQQIQTETQAPLSTELAFETGESTTEPVQTAAEPEEPQETVYTLTFAGDCTLGSTVSGHFVKNGFVATVGDDLSYPFRNVLDIFENDDFTMVNLEGVLADEGNPMTRGYAFRGPVKFAEMLPLASIEAVTLANNHTKDFGPKGYASTLEALNAVQVPYVERDGTAIVTTKSGLKIGLYAMMYYLLDVEDMRADIQQMKEQGAELIIVAPHWGIERRYDPTQQQIDVGRAAIDAGAHIVFGCHPHVLQPIEEYGDGVIYYSLGNFVFGGNLDPEDYDTAIIRQQVIRRADGTLTLGERTIIPASISTISDRNDFQPTPYAEGSEEYDRVLAKLAGTFR